MNITEALKYTLFGILLAALFIPFIVADSQLFPFITGKAFVFRILVEILFGVWLIGMLRDPGLRPRFSWLMGAVLAFVGVMALANIFGVDLYRSFWSNFERMEGFITTLHLLAYFMVASSTLNTRARWMTFFNTSIIASFIMSFYVFLQLSGKIVINQGGVRVDGTFGNATYLAVYMLFNFFIALFLLMRARQEKENQPNYYLYAWYVAALICHVIVTYFTATRGVILGLIGGLLVTTVLISVFEKNRPKLRKISVAALIAVVLLIGGFFAARNTEFVRSSPTLTRFASLSVEEISTQGRRYVWPIAVKGFTEKPILGWGQENFGYVFAKYYDPRMYNQEPWFDHAHNIVLDMMVSGGILGLAGYLSIFAALLILLYKNKTFSVTDKSIIVGLSAAYFFQNLFVFDNLVSSIYFFSLLAFVHSEYVKDKNEPVWLTRFTSNTYIVRKVMPAFIIVVIVALVYALNTKPILANRTIIKALSTNVETADQGVEYFKKAFEYKTFASGEAAEQMFNQFQKFTAAGVSAETKQAFAALAIEKMNEQIEAHPNDVRSLLFMGSLRNRLGDHANSRIYLERALALSPKKQSVLFETGLSYLSTGDYQKSFDAFKTAYDLAPDFLEARVLYAIAALYNKNESVADELLTSIGEDAILYDDRIIAAYAGTGRIVDAVKIMEKRVELNPNNPEILFRLSAGYLMMEQRTKSVGVLRDIIEKFPEHKEQAEYYIKEIQAGRNP